MFAFGNELEAYFKNVIEVCYLAPASRLMAEAPEIQTC
jgi:hypothetical protein